jgi:mycothiol synthase
MKSISIREFERSDYVSIGLIHDSLFPDHPFFRERVEFEDSCCGRTRYRMRRLVAETSSDQVVGFGEYKHLFFSYHPRKFALNIEVHPRWQRQGVGGILYDRLMDELANPKAEALWPLVLSTSSSAIEFLQNRGFSEKKRMLESRLDVRKFDVTGFGKLFEGLNHQGITINSISSEMLTDNTAGRKLDDLEESGAADVPGAITDSPMDFRDYEIIILRSPIMVWEGSFVAKHGDVYVGESSVLKTGMQGVFEQGFTVVRPSYRGRNIAQAVKSQVAIHAKNAGAEYILTHNDSRNAPMLAVNRKIGFVKRAEWIMFEKML